MRFACGVILVLFVGTTAVAQPRVSASSIVNSPHNLSASGPGKIKAATEQEVCIFCHTPHNASVVQPLWNREIPEQSYRIYSSATLIAQPGQPTGSSKLCLSCHDGTIALGNVISRGQSINVIGANGALPPGTTNLGTDLSGDHPISFKYDSDLATKDGKLIDPASLPQQIRLEGGQVQCTSCHDPHDDSRGNFLVMDNSRSQLCSSCHRLAAQSAIQGHDQCVDCHLAHKAPSGGLLLNQTTVSGTCLSCHGGSPLPSAPISAAMPAIMQGTSIASDLAKPSTHNVDNASALSTLRLDGAASISTVTCADCHEPHTIARGSAAAPLMPPTYGDASGMTAQGTPVARAKYEYEVCFKCHGRYSTDQPFISRDVVQTNIAREFSPSAVSFHPVEVPGVGHDVPSLIPTMNTGTIIYCTDCHDSDTAKSAGGSGPNGPHGSDFQPMLVAEYETVDGTSESTQAYALCYRCHERTSILNNESFSRHSFYVVDQRTPCSVCHDAHGISSAQGSMRNNAHLINFDTSVVQPDPLTHKLQYVSTGLRSGRCFLTCHGKVHSGLRYP
ncbi:MAG TPA: cytochrome c3 family protein [Tepidisphaeraceae bacterium]|nr:cytochrome c3 family protein [Tepidisphaeraceae bacterium]